MAGKYEKSMYNQLMEVMVRLDAVEKELHVEKIEHKEDDARLNEKIDNLTQKNKLLRDDNTRLKSIINNDSSNTSLPPSTDDTEIHIYADERGEFHIPPEYPSDVTYGADYQSTCICFI